MYEITTVLYHGARRVGYHIMVYKPQPHPTRTATLLPLVGRYCSHATTKHYLYSVVLYTIFLHRCSYYMLTPGVFLHDRYYNGKAPLLLYIMPSAVVVSNHSDYHEMRSNHFLVSISTLIFVCSFYLNIQQRCLLIPVLTRHTRDRCVSICQTYFIKTHLFYIFFFF